MVASIASIRDLTSMPSHSITLPGCKWLFFLLTLSLYGCSDPEAEQIRDLSTRLDEAQVHIEAQTARIAGLERRLITAAQGLRQTRSSATSLKHRLSTLLKQRQALLQDQNKLRLALSRSQTGLGAYNQQLLLIGQQNNFLHQRIKLLDAWLRHRTAGIHTQSREIATLHAKLNKSSVEQSRLQTALAKQSLDLSSAANRGNASDERVEKLQRARTYLEDKLAAVGQTLKQNKSKHEANIRRAGKQLAQQSDTISAHDLQQQKDQQSILELKTKLAVLEERNTSPDPALDNFQKELLDCRHKNAEFESRGDALGLHNAELKDAEQNNLKLIGELMQQASACTAPQSTD